MSGVYTFEFDAPDVLLNMNDRVHWRKRSAQVKNWRRAACDAVPANCLELPPCIVRVTLPVRDTRRRDPMNFVATTKAIVDGMVDAGIWPDDDGTWVTNTEPKLDKRYPRRVVTVVLEPR